jgi:hypothetical protein
MSETLSKEELVESLNNNILHIENLRARIERLEETCKDIVDGMRHSNRVKKTNIPESCITMLDQMEKELTGIDTSLCNVIIDLHSLRFFLLSRDAPKYSSPSRKHATGKKNID